MRWLSSPAACLFKGRNLLSGLFLWQLDIQALEISKNLLILPAAFPGKEQFCGYYLF